MQLSPAVIKQKIRFEHEKKEQRRLFWALVGRSLSIIIFAIIFISTANFLFGSQNSGVSVSLFCLLLGMRYVPYGYKMIESQFALLLTFIMMFVGSVVTSLDRIVFALIINFTFILIILILTSNEPMMGNGGLYVFSYLFIVNTPVTGKILLLRAAELALGFLIIGLIMFLKHQNKHKDIRLKSLLQSFNLKQDKSLWQFRLALGVSLGLFAGQILNLPKAVWVGYACMSVLLPHEGKLFNRAFSRFTGVILGSLLFLVIYPLWPKNLIFWFGPLAGIFLGFTAKYFWASVFNCFGALLLAATVFGMPEAPFLRIWNNLIGILFAVIFWLIFETIVKTFNQDKIGNQNNFGKN